jgi:RimJ/RimL family protein N-acetyltransferase
METTNHSNQTIRPTTLEDLVVVMDLYAQARAFMKKEGNPHQWKDHHPSRAMIEEDIRQGKSWVCVKEEEILGVFYFSPQEDDPTYRDLVEGAWLDERPYGVIHRIAVGSRLKGIAAFCLDWCWQQCHNIRIDTHEDNGPMRRFLEKQGFRQCGVVRLEDGSLRLAYQKSIDQNFIRGGHHGQ